MNGPARSGRLVSVIIPAFNGERYLGEAIQSVLAQTYHPFEIIVVDDGSTDLTADVARAFETVQYAHQPHSGLGSALNYGLGLARGDFIAFLDADDLWVEPKLAHQIARFDRDPAVDIVFGYAQPFYSHDSIQGYKALEPTPGYAKGTMLVTREAFLRVGPFDPQWKIGDFVDWYLRAEERGLKFVMLSEVLLKRRIHANNMGLRERDHRKDYARILKRALNRRNQPQKGAPDNA